MEFNLPEDRANHLSSATLTELDKLLDLLLASNHFLGLILRSVKPQTFAAGEDLREIERLYQVTAAEATARLGQQVCAKLARLPFPTVAVIDGACLGSGLELVLACDYRIATDAPETVFGFPEVPLGFIPAFGGLQRLPQLIGLRAALRLIVTGKSMTADWWTPAARPGNLMTPSGASPTAC